MIAAGKIAAGKNRSRTAVSPSRKGQAQDGQRVSGKEELTEDKEDRVVPPFFGPGEDRSKAASEWPFWFKEV